jgi:T5orf172 domain.
MADNTELHERYFPQIKTSYPKIYAYRIDERPGQIKVGFTSREDYKERIREQEGQMHIHAHLLAYWDAIRSTGETFTDHAVHRLLEERGIRRVKDHNGKKTEFFECKIEDVIAAVESIKSGNEISASRINTYGPRDEQEDTIKKTIAYYKSEKLNNPSKTPKFLWNAKMRFGKTYTSLEMVKRLDLSKVLIISFKVEVKDSWKK